MNSLLFVAACTLVAASLSQDLACPEPALYFRTNRSEPACNSTDDCTTGELCCVWNGFKHCLQGLDTTPRPGSCPVQEPVGNSLAPCRADYAGCRFDSECSADQKCCQNAACEYNECMAAVHEPILDTAEDSVPAIPTPKFCTEIGCGEPQAGPNCKLVEELRPNGAGCEPVCRVCRDPPPPPVTPTSKLDCPDYPFYFEVPLEKPICKADSDCASGEKCCWWGSGKQCQKGVDTTPKPGVCPAVNFTRGSPSHGCRADYGGCQHDSECSGDHKCCQSPSCSYKECRAPLAPPPSAPVECTEIGCGEPAASPDCKLVEEVRPNGLGCEPVCRVCRDPPPPPPSTPSPSVLVCPTYPLYFNVPPTQPICSSDVDCGAGEKCCRWGLFKQCITGVSSISKPGVCPNGGLDISLENLERIPLSNCRMDYMGCSYDSECSGNQKCCKSIGCGYNECTDPQELTTTRQPENATTQSVNTTEVTPANTAPQELVCPTSPFYFNIPIRQPVCANDSDCEVGEKCCFWGDAMQCKKGVSTIPKPGSCPATTPPPRDLVPSFDGCLMDFAGCSYDSDCDGDHKCCGDPVCNYNICVPPAPPAPPSLILVTSPLEPPSSPTETTEATSTNSTAEGTPADTLGCPDYPFWFDVPLKDPLCSTDNDCSSGQKCCDWGSGRQCKTGLVTTAKPGSCPADGGVKSHLDCIMDYNGCLYDSECPGAQKCCRDAICGYNECMGPAPAGQPVPTTTTSAPTTPAPTCRTYRRMKCRKQPKPFRRECIKMRRKLCGLRRARKRFSKNRVLRRL